MMELHASRPPGSRRALLAYVGVLVAADLAFATALTPLLSGYTHLAGMSKAAAGILMGAYPLGSVVGALPAGLAVGRIGSRAAVLLGLAVTGGAAVTFGWSSAAGVLIAARFAQGAAGSCTWAGGMAWLSAVTPAKCRGQVLGTAMGFAVAGTVAGPAVGAAAAWAGPRLVFTGAAAVSVALMAAAFTIPRPGNTADRIGLPGPRVLGDRRIVAGMALTALGGAAVGTLDVLAPLRLTQLGAAALVIAVAYTAAGAAEIALSPRVGRLSDRRGNAAAAQILLAAGATVAVAFPLVGQAGWLAALLVIGMPAYGCLCIPGAVLLSTGADRLYLHQGMAFGLANLAWSGGQAGAAMAAGALAKAVSDLLPAVLLAGLYLVALAVLRPGSRKGSGCTPAGAEDPVLAADHGRTT
jgi:predicted MFS family arabinose efflux permease